MKRDVKGQDFSDETINAFFDSIERVNWSTVQPVPADVREQARRFAESAPRPSPDELRSHVDHAVQVARGWDHPFDAGMMFAAAVKSYYLLAWLEYLQQAQDNQQCQVDVQLAMKVTFTPVTTMRVTTDIEREG